MYRNPSLAVDAVVMDAKKILLVRRKNDPFKGFYALPGGFVEYGETTENAVLRELGEETGIEGKVLGIVGVFSDPERDPRKHVVSIAYLVKPVEGELKASDDAVSCHWAPLKDLPVLAFDHRSIIGKATGVME